MKIKICCLSGSLFSAFSEVFADVEAVEIVATPFEAVQDCDAMVSAANSFGLMDGGVDAAITAFFGEQLMHRVKKHIVRQYLGEQPVGTAFIIGTRSERFPWLIHAPTMRVPMNIAGCDHVYQATRAALVAIHHHNEHSRSPITSVCFPAMGAGTGGVSPRSCALQMRLAYDSVNQRPSYLDWNFAIVREKSIACVCEQ